jgi:hypothetical protein
LAKKPKSAVASKGDGDEAAFLEKMRLRAQRAREADRDNRSEATRDMEFRVGVGQWPKEALEARLASDRPALTINKIPQFIRQVTGDIRQMKPALKAYGVDDNGDKERAEVVTSLLRYIENRSDATDAYFRAVDSQVTSGIGHWRVDTEVCDEDTGEQDITIRTVDDQINVLWDPDTVKANKEDAQFCFVPVDMTMDAFREKYPNASAAGFDTAADYRGSMSGTSADGEWWSHNDTIRIAEYWERKESKGGVEVWRSVVSHSETLEPAEKRPGKYIPIIPVIGEEIRIGPRVYRHGMVRFLRDPQQRYNYWVTAETEIVALQPKSPYLVTETQVEDHLDQWTRANQDNLPFLTYTPDAQAPPPQRVQPPVSSQGFSEGIAQAAEDMKAVTGIYDASLGQRSNETSGKAIMARQREGDVGTYVYVDNFLRAIKHTGRVILDLIPSIYDTTRTLRIIGEDGAVDEMKINQPVGAAIEGEDAAYDNDVRIGKYDIFVQAGPSYTTKREEAREGMMAFIQAFPPAGPIIGDLIATAQDWPHADKIAERLKSLLPPAIAQKEAEEEGAKDGMRAPQPQVPPPEVIAQEVAARVMQGLDAQVKQAEIATKSAQARKAEADANKAELELQMMVMQATQPQPQPQPMPMEESQPDPMQAIELEAYKAARLGEVNLALEARRKQMDRDDLVASGSMEEGADGNLAPQGTQAMAQVLDAVQTLAQQVRDIVMAQNAPKRIVRDPKTGKVSGVETVGLTQNISRRVVRDPTTNEIVGVETVQ